MKTFKPFNIFAFFFSRYLSYRRNSVNDALFCWLLLLSHCPIFLYSLCLFSFKAINFHSMKFSQHFNFLGFFDHFWISRHFIFAVQPKCYILSHFSFVVWPIYYNHAILIWRLCWKLNFLYLWVSQILGIGEKYYIFFFLYFLCEVPSTMSSGSYI